MKYYTREFGEMGSLVIPRSVMGIEVLPLPFKESRFFNSRKLSEGFFLLEEISEESFNALMELRDGITEDTPHEALRERKKSIKLIVQAL